MAMGGMFCVAASGSTRSCLKWYKPVRTKNEANSTKPIEFERRSSRRCGQQCKFLAQSEIMTFPQSYIVALCPKLHINVAMISAQETSVIVSRCNMHSDALTSLSLLMYMCMLM